MRECHNVFRLRHLQNHATAMVGSQQWRVIDDEPTVVQRMLRILREFQIFDKVAAHIAAHTEAIKHQGSPRNSLKFVFVIIYFFDHAGACLKILLKAVL